MQPIKHNWMQKWQKSYWKLNHWRKYSRRIFHWIGLVQCVSQHKKNLTNSTGVIICIHKLIAFFLSRNKQNIKKISNNVLFPKVMKSPISSVQMFEHSFLVWLTHFTSIEPNILYFDNKITYFSSLHQNIPSVCLNISLQT